MHQPQIIPYENKHREMVRRCVYDTGFGGASADVYFEDADLFADLNTLYYTDHEPRSAFVALVGGAPAGYLLGCIDTAAYERKFSKEILPSLFRNILLGRYNLAPGVRRYLLRGIVMMARGEVPNLPKNEYPAHLHIDLFKEYRRAGVGGALMREYFRFLRARGVPGVHLVTSSVHTESHPFYEKLGFRLHSKTRVKLSPFKELDNADFYNIVYVRDMSPLPGEENAAGT